MSQIPPATGQPAPYGQPTPSGNYQVPATQGNAWGLTSLIVGIVCFCLPFLGGLLAIIFGIMGIKKSKATRSGGGLSIAGLILGILSIAFWALCGGGVLAFVKGTAPMRDAAKQTIQDLATGNMIAAQRDTDGSISQDELQSAIDTVKPHGTVTDVTCSSVGAATNTATGSRGDVAGVATFADKSQVKFQFTEVKSGDKWKVSKISFLP